MKKHLLIILLLLCQASLYAQTGECEYDKNEMDKFTNKKVVWTKWGHLAPLISRDYAPDVRGVVEDTVKQLIFLVSNVVFTNDKPSVEKIEQYRVVPPGSKALLLLENGKTVELVTDTELHSRGNYDLPRKGGNSTDQYRVNYSVALIYKLTEDAMKTLASQGVTNLRIYFKPDVYEDYTVGKKKYATIQNLVACLR